MISSVLKEYSTQLKQKGLHRKRMLAGSVEGSVLINFSSNDYLSLAENADISAAFQRGFANYPSGSGGSMVICGYHPIHKDLERAFSDALNADDALLFSSGYAANLGVIALLAKAKAQVFIDKGAHASCYDGLELAKANYSRFLHNDFESLAGKLQSAQAKHPVVLTESVFSMSGHASNLSELRAICGHFNADCIIDEAHAFGVLGPQGLGAVAEHGLSQQDIPLRIIPLGKAFAAQGAMVVGQGEWIDALLQSARSHIYSTAVSPALAYGLLEILTFIQAADDRRQKLFELIHYFQQSCVNSPLNWRHSNTPIQQLRLGCPHKALAYATSLRSAGIFCQAMREPTVNKKDTGLRVVLNYHHEPEQIDYLFSKLHELAI